ELSLRSADHGDLGHEEGIDVCEQSTAIVSVSGTGQNLHDLELVVLAESHDRVPVSAGSSPVRGVQLMSTQSGICRASRASIGSLKLFSPHQARHTVTSMRTDSTRAFTRWSPIPLESVLALLAG